MPELDQLVYEPGDYPLGAAIEFWRNAFGQGGDLCNAHRLSDPRRGPCPTNSPPGSMLNVPVLFHSAPVAAVKELPTAHSGQEDRASPPRAGSIKTFHALSPWLDFPVAGASSCPTEAERFVPRLRQRLRQEARSFHCRSGVGCRQRFRRLPRRL